jgi:predicted nucleic acid-binding protein
LFTQIFVPESVIRELQHRDAPHPVRTWALALPSWIQRESDPVGIPLDMKKLHPGERAAILLAESVPADILIVDERAARTVAENRGMRVTGTLGVLGESAARGSLDLTVAIDALRRTNFRCSPALLKSTLDRFGSRPHLKPG